MEWNNCAARTSSEDALVREFYKVMERKGDSRTVDSRIGFSFS